jgi:hypothetical protein
LFSIVSEPIESMLSSNNMICGGPEWDVVSSIDDGCHPRLDSQLCRLGVELGYAYDLHCALGTPPMSCCARNIHSDLPHRWAVAASTGGPAVRGVATGYQIIACFKLRTLVTRAGQGNAETGRQQRVISNIK